MEPEALSSTVSPQSYVFFQITGVTFPRVSILIITISQEMTGYIRFLGIPTLHFSAGTCHSNQGDQDLVTAESRLSHGCAFLL